MKRQETNLGAAHLYIELKDNRIYVYHGDDKTLLLSRKAHKGTWDNIFRTISGKR